MKELDIVYTDKYLTYELGEDNPISRTKTQDFLQKIKRNKEFSYHILEPKKATLNDLLLVHTTQYLNELERLALNNLEFDADTPVNRGMIEGGLYIVGGTILTLNLALQDKKVVNLIGGMHHAGSYQASGFCIYNDHSIAIRKLQIEGKIKRAAVIDLDVHAGQGTQEIFYRDPNILTISIHQDPQTIYPGVGFDWQKGEEEGLGTNINVPLPPKTGEDTYLRALDSVIPHIDVFNPDIKILVLGVDTFEEDYLGRFKLKIDSFKKIGKRFKDWHKLAVLFGGGYSTKIPDLWISFLEGYLK